MREIPKEYYCKCMICNKNIKQIKKEIGGSGVYNANAFKKHIAQHDISIEIYFEKYFNLKADMCPCGICGKQLKITTKDKFRTGFFWFKYACGRNEGLKKWSEKAKIDRSGINNPMHGKIPWNKGKTKKDSDSVKKISEKRMGMITTKATRKKQSESAKKRTTHGNTGKKHSEESKIKMSQATIRQIKRGDFKHTKTKPHIEMGKILKCLNLQFEEEKTVEYWSFDYYIKDYDLYIEVDGDYFHSNPKIFPDGPKTKTQKINWIRDIKKNKYCQKNNLALLRFWESDILSNVDFIKKELIKYGIGNNN